MGQRIEDMDVQLRAARRNLDEAKAAQAQSQGREQRRQAEMEDEVRRLKRRCEQLEAERAGVQNAGVRTLPLSL
jgi:chromosome segregation ATPase